MTSLRNLHPHSSSSLATLLTSSSYTTLPLDLSDLGHDHILGKRTSKLFEVDPIRSLRIKAHPPCFLYRLFQLVY